MPIPGLVIHVDGTGHSVEALADLSDWSTQSLRHEWLSVDFKIVKTPDKQVTLRAYGKGTLPACDLVDVLIFQGADQCRTVDLGDEGIMAKLS